MRRLGQSVERLSVWIERKSNVLGSVVRGLQAWAWWDFRHNVSHSVLGLIALAMIGAGAFSIEGWTKGNELRIALGGFLVLGMLAWTGRQRQKEILLLYKIAHKGRTEWKGTVFDIRRRYLREFHEKLDALYAGIELYARYRKRSGEDEETQRISLSQHQKKAIDWENNSSVRIRSICYEWSADEKQVRLEYRRTPAQVYAARFLQTKGIGAEDYEQLNTLLVEEEWKIRPRFAWVCQLGIGSIAAIVFVLTAAIFWGGPSAFLGSEIGTILPNRAPGGNSSYGGTCIVANCNNYDIG